MVVTKYGNHATKPKKSTRKIPDGYKLVPPDGNYAWIVAFACCIAGMVAVSIIPAFSVLLDDIILLYKTNTATATWIPSMFVTTIYILGPVNAIVVSTFGVRKTAIAGGLFISLGLTTSYFVDRIELLCITYGTITGFGSGLCTMAYTIVLSQYFKKYFGIAIGLLLASFSTAKLVTIPLTQYLLSKYGCRGVFLVLGATTLNLCVAASLFQPVRRHLVLAPIDIVRVEDTTKHSSRDDDNSANDIQEITPLTAPQDATDKEDKPLTTIWLCLSACCKKTFSKLDFRLLREPLFYIVSGNVFLLSSIMIFSDIFLFSLGVEKGNTALQLTSIISTKAICDMIAIIAGPSIVTYLKVSVIKSYITLGFVNGIVLAAIIFVTDYSKLLIWTSATGLAFGAASSLSRVLVVETMGAQRLSSIIGLSNFIQAFFFIPLAPFLGWIRDSTGSFTNVYLVLAFMQFIIITLWIIKPYVPQKPQP